MQPAHPGADPFVSRVSIFNFIDIGRNINEYMEEIPMKGDLSVRGTLKDRLAVSVVVPVYNEEESILLLYEKVRDACGAIREIYKIIFVYDGSRDRTFAVLEEIHNFSGII